MMQLRPWLVVVVSLACPTLAVGGGDRACILSDQFDKRLRPAVVAAVAELGEAAQRIDLVDMANLQGCPVVVAIGSKAVAVAEGRRDTLPMVSALASVASDNKHFAIINRPDPRRVADTLMTLAPAVRRVGTVYDPEHTGALVEEGRAAFRAHGVELVAVAAKDTSAAVRAFHRFTSEVAVDALWILPDRTTTTRETAYQALELAAWRRIPAVGPSRWYVASGALFALQVDGAAHGVLAAQTAQQIMAGSVPRRRQYASRDALIVSARTAERLGLTLSPAVRARAAEVIE